MGQLSTLVQALEWWKQENLSSREPKPHNETLSPKKRNTEAVLLVHSPADQITHVHKVTHKGSTHLPSVNTLTKGLQRKTALIHVILNTITNP